MQFPVHKNELTRASEWNWCEVINEKGWKKQNKRKKIEYAQEWSMIHHAYNSIYHFFFLSRSIRFSVHLVSPFDILIFVAWTVDYILFDLWKPFTWIPSIYSRMVKNSNAKSKRRRKQKKRWRKKNSTTITIVIAITTSTKSTIKSIIAT